MENRILQTLSETAKAQSPRSIVVILLIVAAAATAFYRISYAYIIERAEENVTSLLLSHRGIHHYVQNILIPAYVDYQKKGRIPADFYAPELLSSSFIIRNQHTFYNQERQSAGLVRLYYKLAADNPRNPINRADRMEEDLIRMFNEHREIKSFKKIIEVDGQKNLYVAIPFLENRSYCMYCHGKREDAPLDLQQRYPGEGGFNEKIGQIRAITSIRSPIQHEYTHIYMIGFTILFGVMTFSGLFFFNARLRVMVDRKTRSLEKEIDERKTAENNLRENRSTLKQILDTTPQSIFWKDIDSIYLGCNRIFAKAAGLDDPDGIVGMSDFDLPWPEEEAEAYRADDREVTTSGRAKLHIIEPLQQADGSRLWIDTTKVPLLDEDGEIYGILGVYEDITEKKRAEEENEELEKRLRQAQKMESIGTLASGIAHDFNNILSIIMGYTELAMGEEDLQSMSGHLEEIRSGGERAKELVRQILTFSRKTEHSHIPIQVSPIIKEAVKMLRSSIPKTIDIVQNIKSKGIALIDPTQIHQVMMNLCINGYHAMRETGGTLTISLDEVDILEEDEGYGDLVHGRYLRLDIEDTGCGMSHEIQDRIFEPYFTTKETGEGTGLGLAVVHGIVKNHNGHISVYSEPDHGTIFHVYLPMVEIEAVQLDERDEVEDINGSGEEIMVIDDEVQITEINRRHLSKAGYNVSTFTNAVLALEEFQKNPQKFDMIITDMTMPYMTGAALSQKALSIRPDIPIILCTGQSEAINRNSAHAMGISGYLKKPILKHDLLVAVKKAFKLKIDQR